MKNRDSNENIYRNLEKCYALLQVHILFSFHTLLYILLITHRKVRKIIGENRRISEKIGENRGISEENARKIGEFPRNPFLEVAEPKEDPAVVSGHFRSFPVVSGRFRSFLRSFLEKIREFRRISEKNGEYRRHLSVFFPFLFLFVPFHSSTPRFSSPNVKSYLIIRFFVVNIWIIRKFVVSLHCLKKIMI